jgi:hypothetical protein
MNQRFKEYGLGLAAIVSFPIWGPLLAAGVLLLCAVVYVRWCGHYLLGGKQTFKDLGP